ncbi:alanine aminotransferase 2-like [Thalassophryne amazonica]|uniref:alanine aminotransferase 2-like n=1 Tax=Thalassophryne amazonica TaxID=390379 RepID=UPI001471DB90|nr:alanine aminotransferase 2-like [Thalassophryne amazonica]
MSILQESSPNMKNTASSKPTVPRRQKDETGEDVRQETRQPDKDVINLFWGDPHKAGLKPLTFVRQVLAVCVYPELMNSDKLPVDVKHRAQEQLEECVGGSVGSYFDATGISQVTRSISEFISRRDGGVVSHPENIFSTAGSEMSLKSILSVLVNCEKSLRTGVLFPVPGFDTAVWTTELLGGVVVPYYLNEDQGWELEVQELHRALESAKGVCDPVALYVVNPGNPTGHIQTRTSIEEVIRFAFDKKLFLLVDEVYQDCVSEENCHFVSYKRVLTEMGPPFSETVELASFHSISKGLLGECGLRSGYVELVNLDPAVMKHIKTMFSADCGPPVTGQIAFDLMLNPPIPEDPSYDLYNEETQQIKTTLVRNAKRAAEVLNNLPGVSCQPPKGAYVFPRLYLPPKAIQKAKEVGTSPDVFYCDKLLEEARISVRPGCTFGQKEGTYHIRIFIKTSEDMMEELLKRLTSFHARFMRDFS